MGKKSGKEASKAGSALQGQKHSYFKKRGFRAHVRFSAILGGVYSKSEASSLETYQSLSCFHFR